MGSRKKQSAELLNEATKQRCQAVLRDCPTSPRKMRLVTDMIRGMAVNRALDVLKFSSKEASRRVEKLLLSAVANWQAKNEGVRLEESNLYVQEVFVDSARMLKRLRPAPQGRGHRIRKRSNHVTVRLASKNVVEENTK
ncbi:MAG: 50S ribosomal protein L22 [Prolixibacteraceae bacterium]